MTDREQLIEHASELNWFHAIDLGDCQTPGRSPRGTAQNKSLFGVMELLSQIDLNGLHCIDVGTVDGLVAFNMASRGAERVVATDIPRRKSFLTARDLLGLDVELYDHTTFENIFEKVEEHSFDVVVCSGVMYHMLNPFDAVLKARRLLKRNGLLLLQTRFDPGESGAKLDFNYVSGQMDQLYVYWLPSQAALTGMLALAGFRLLAIRTGSGHSFITMLGRNVDVDEITEGPDLITRHHERGGAYLPEFNRTLDCEDSEVSYAGPQDVTRIDDKTFIPNFFPHPTDDKPLVGAQYKAERSAKLLRDRDAGLLTKK